MSDEDSEVVQQRDISKKRRIFTIDEKLEVVDFIKSHSINEASRKFKIDRQNIREWQKRKQKLLSLRESKSGKRLILDGAGRHLRDKEFDDQMIAWIRTQRACNQRVSRRTIQIHALQIANQADEEETIFKASCGWLNKLMLRHNLRVRIPTTVCQKPPIEYEKKLVDFILYIQRQRQSNIYHHIYAADETAVWLDASGGKCVAVKGAKEVSVLTTGHDKLRLTLMLTGRSDGYKCLPYVLLPRKRPDAAIEAKFKNKLHLVWAGGIVNLYQILLL
uniref:Brinker DNA-binding domain-containing protein n=1 Tax=Globodera rostochiensis TaxID=31243 RepID=A0A914HR63_GLORO